MSNFDHDFSDCRCQATPCSEIELIIRPRERDLGGFNVRRCLPSAQKPLVGPFIFFDHLGPTEFPAGAGIDVRPHPHINLSTVTYLFEGEILHRDSLGSVQPILPGAINWMTAGKGIVHSERTPPKVRQQAHRVHALQLWVALPKDQEEVEPDFSHYPAEQLPVREEEGLSLQVMVGEAYGLSSPVKVHSETLYVAVELAAGKKLTLPNNVQERGLYLVSGEIHAGTTALEQHCMTVFQPGAAVELTAVTDCRLALIGGEPLGERQIWWNFVSSRPERIEQAKQDWLEQRFPAVPGETEVIPMPKS